MNVLKAIDRALGNRASPLLHRQQAALTAFCGAVVFIRFVPIAKLSWSDEIIEWLMASLIFMAAAELWRENDHFKIDFMIQKAASTRFGRLFSLGLEILTAAFILAFFQYSLDLTVSMARTSPILSWPMTWWYAPMPTAGFIMLAYSMRNIVQGFRAVVDGFKQRAANRPGAA